MKKILFVLFTTLLLASCNLEIVLPSNGSSMGGSSSPEWTSSTSSQGGNNTSQGGNTSSQGQEGTTSSAQGGQTQTFSFEEPNFETRVINSIDDVTFDDFFNLGNRIDIKAYVSNAELNYLAQDRQTGHKNQTYHRCDKVVITLKNSSNTFTWEYENVGIRQKGNTSRKEIFNGDGNLNLNHFKLSFDETFTDTEMYSQSYINQYGNPDFDKREFLNSLSGLDIKWNKNEDRTNIKEIYSSYLYHAGGIVTSHIGLANFSIVEVDKNNKETSMGLCTVFEPSSKSLIKRAMQSEDKSYVNLPTWDEEKKGTFGVPEEKYGDYYECGWGTGDGGTSNGANLTPDSISGKKIGIGNLSGSYIPAYERKTNTSVTDYNDGLLRNMVDVIHNGDYNAINNVVDLEEFAIKEGIEYYLGNPDGMRYNANNYKIYFRRTDGKAMFVPIDTDRCFGIIKDWNVKDALKNESPWSTKDASDNTYKNRIFSKTILASNNNATKAKYQEVITSLRQSSWLENETFNKFFNKAKASYPERNLSLNDNNISFSSYISSKNNAVDIAFNLNNAGGNNSGGNSSTSSNTQVANNTRIYFENSSNWNDVYCYMYGANFDNGGYPGREMSYYTTVNGKDIYYYDIGNANYTHVIFNNGGSGEFNQTEKIETSVIGKSTIFKLGSLSDRNRYYLTYEDFSND